MMVMTGKQTKGYSFKRLGSISFARGWRTASENVVASPSSAVVVLQAQAVLLTAGARTLYMAAGGVQNSALSVSSLYYFEPFITQMEPRSQLAQQPGPGPRYPVRYQDAARACQEKSIEWGGGNWFISAAGAD